MTHKKLAVGFILSVVIGQLAYASGSSESGEESQKEAAAILYHTNLDVKVRRSNELVWNTASDMMRLYDHDAVKTGDRSSVTIQFQDETVLNVDEKSMVIIIDSPKKLDARESIVALPSGAVQGRIARNVERPLQLTVRTSRGWIRATSATQKANESRFNASVGPTSDLKVKNLDGEVKVLAVGRERRLEPGESLRMSSTKESAKEDSGVEPKYFRELPAATGTEIPVMKVMKPSAPKKTVTVRKPIQKKVSHKLPSGALDPIQLAEPAATTSLRTPQPIRTAEVPKKNEHDDENLPAPNLIRTPEGDQH